MIYRVARALRIDLGDYVYHCLNRANGRMRIFDGAADYRDFEYLLNEMRESFDMRILAYVVMPNHWHLLAYPKEDGDLSGSFKWLGTSHATRHHARKETVGNGHLYQGRYKSFLVEEDHHLLTVLKYIERNPVRAGLVQRPEDWRWGSAYRRIHGTPQEQRLLAELPVDLPRDYVSWLNTPEPSEELSIMRNAVNKGVSYGDVILPEHGGY